MGPRTGPQFAGALAEVAPAVLVEVVVAVVVVVEEEEEEEEDAVATAIQSGPSSNNGLLVTFVWPLPSAFITKISRLAPGASASEAKAIFVPSGDQTGWKSHADGLFVRFTWPLPSAFMTKISGLPVWKEVKAIRVPSGDQSGSEFAHRSCW